MANSPTSSKSNKIASATDEIESTDLKSDDQKEDDDKQKEISSKIERDESIERDSTDSQLQQSDSFGEKDSESSCSSASNCTILNMNDKLNETIETIPECLNEADASSPSSKKSSPNQETSMSTFSKVKKSIGSPINIRKTLFKQNSDKRKGSNFKFKESKDA